MRLWDLTAADPNAAVRTLTGHRGNVNHVAFAPDGKTLASASWDHTVRLWDLTARDPNAAVRTLTGHRGNVNHVAFAPDGKTLASASWDHTVRLWDLTALIPMPPSAPSPDTGATSLTWPLLRRQDAGLRVI